MAASNQKTVENKKTTESLFFLKQIFHLSFNLFWFAGPIFLGQRAICPISGLSMVTFEARRLGTPSGRFSPMVDLGEAFEPGEQIQGQRVGLKPVFFFLRFRVRNLLAYRLTDMTPTELRYVTRCRAWTRSWPGELWGEALRTEKQTRDSWWYQWYPKTQLWTQKSFMEMLFIINMN